MTVSRISVRYGHVVFQVNSVDEAAQLYHKLVGHTETGNGAGRTGGVLAQAATVANTCLAKITSGITLHGKAMQNLGTALRVRAVRERLAPELLRDLGYVADAADARRHLTSTTLDAIPTRLGAALDGHKDSAPRSPNPSSSPRSSSTSSPTSFASSPTASSEQGQQTRSDKQPEQGRSVSFAKTQRERTEEAGTETKEQREKAEESELIRRGLLSPFATTAEQGTRQKSRPPEPDPLIMRGLKSPFA